MKKLLLPLLALSVSIGYGQSQTDPREESGLLSQSELQQIQQVQHQKKINAQRKKTQGGVVSQRMSHADVADGLFSSQINAVFSPMAPDSTYIQNFGSPSAISAHGWGTTFDPASTGFTILGQDYFDYNDPYTVDTVYIGSRYRTSSSVSGLTGDTLQVVLVMGDTLDNNVWRVGIGWNAGAYPGQTKRIEVIPPRYTGNPTVGVPGTLDAPTQIVMKYALTAADTAITYKKIVPPNPINVPGGQKVGVFVTFIPGQSYNPATQTYYRSGGKGDVNNLSYIRLQNSTTGDNNSYFLEPLTLGAPSAAISYTLFSDTRYAAWTGSDAFRNEYPSPSATRAYLIDFWISGTSTVGIDEVSANESLKVYPNPSTGRVNITTKSGGTYNLTMVDILGKVVYQEKISVNGSEVISRDFSDLPKGIYMIGLETNGQRTTSKFTLK